MSGQQERWDGLDHSDQLHARDATLDLTRMIEPVRQRIDADGRGHAPAGNGAASAAPDWRPEERWQETPGVRGTGSHAAPPRPDVPAEPAAARPGAAAPVPGPGPGPAVAQRDVPALPSGSAGSRDEADSRAEAGPGDGAVQVGAADLAWRPTERPVPGSLADLRQRLERLPLGHPSSPYHVDGQRKPPPPRLRHLELAPPAPGRAGLDRPPLGHSDQDLPEPDLAGTNLAELDLAEPDLAELPEPDLAEPDLAEPDLAEPDLAEPDLPQPDPVAAEAAQDELADGADLASVESSSAEWPSAEPASADWPSAEPASAESPVAPVTADLAEPDLTDAGLPDTDLASIEPGADLVEPDLRSAGHPVPNLAEAEPAEIQYDETGPLEIVPAVTASVITASAVTGRAETGSAFTGPEVIAPEAAGSPARSPVFIPRNGGTADMARPSQTRFEPTRPATPGQQSDRSGRSQGGDPYLPSAGRAGPDPRRPDWVARADSPSTMPVIREPDRSFREPDRSDPRRAPLPGDDFPGTGRSAARNRPPATTSAARGRSAARNRPPATTSAARGRSAARNRPPARPETAPTTGRRVLRPTARGPGDRPGSAAIRCGSPTRRMTSFARPRGAKCSADCTRAG